MTPPGQRTDRRGHAAGNLPSHLSGRTIPRLVGEWVSRLGRVWVEGQIAELTRRGGTVFLTLRDPVAAVSVRVICPRAVLEASDPAPAEGARVVIWVKPDFSINRGAFALTALELRAVGLGELLARLERLRRELAAEGLFAAARKRPLPFLPGVVGLVCGRGSAAERDVLENAARRWPAVRFRVENASVQGGFAVAEVTDALQRLDADPAVEVIIIARGGGSVEDLLPFSDESLIRAVAASRTPVVSAIGHEQDAPLLDLVADVRASTPTDAARRVVPDVSEQLELIAGLRARARGGWAASWTGSCPGWPACGPGRCWPRLPGTSSGARSRWRHWYCGPGAAWPAGWTGLAMTSRHPGPAAGPVPGQHAAPRLRDRAARRRHRRAGRSRGRRRRGGQHQVRRGPADGHGSSARRHTRLR